MQKQGWNKNKWLGALAGGWCLAACGGPITDSNDLLQSETTLKFGQVSLSSSEMKVAGMTVGSGSASALFSMGTTNPAQASGGKCKTEQKSNCSVITCELPKSTNTTNTGTTNTTIQTASAGVIDIKGTLKAIQLTPDGKTYTSYSSQERLWAGGETINVEAKGADVPAFKLSASAPSAVNLTSPEWTVGTPLSVTKAKALELAWSNGKSGDVSVILTGANDTNSTSITCRFSASAGKGSISPELLGLIPVNAKSAALTVNGSAQSKTTVGGYEINLILNAIASTASGVASTQVTFK